MQRLLEISLGGLDDDANESPSTRAQVEDRESWDHLKPRQSQEQPENDEEGKECDKTQHLGLRNEKRERERECTLQ